MLAQVEQALLRCNGDAFADICRRYLSYKYDIIHSTGSMTGKQKSKKGTPDNFVTVGEYFIFNEITTVATRLAIKLKKDITNCFTQTSIPLDKINTIILMCNSKVDADMTLKLIEYKNTFSTSTDLEIIGIDSLATILLRDHQTLVRDLGIPIDTGQIQNITDFIKNYENSKFATTLSNTFFNRDAEVKEGLEQLNFKDIVLLFGDAGVGKTKIALQLAKDFCKNNSDYTIKCISSNGNLDIWDDLKMQIRNEKNYLIIVDDANKLKSNFELILNFIKSENRTGKIKLILTVRNYVKKDIEGFLRFFSSLEIKKFDRNDLARILQSSDYNITNYYVERIYNLSKGNPRLAIMAAIAGINKDLDKINDASSLYEEYFSSVKTNIGAFDDEKLLLVAGILSLFKTIDFSQSDVLEEIMKHFAIDKDQLYEKCKLLSKYEIADEFGNVFKVADQILAEYIFYIIFIRDQKIPFKLLLDIHYSKSQFALQNVLAPIINNYGFDKIKGFLYNSLKDKWDEISSENSIKSLQFLKDFWFYIPTETLLYLNNNIQNNINPDFNEYSFTIFEINHIESYSDSVFDILLNFKQYPEKYNSALELLNLHGLKNQENFSKLLKAYCQTLSFGKYSYEAKYSTEIALFDFLYKKAKFDKNFYSKIILFIAPTFLKTHFHTTTSHFGSIYLSNITIQLTTEQKKFRNDLWDFIFSCYKDQSLKVFVDEFFIQYIQLNCIDANKDIISFDKERLIPFFKENFEKNSFLDNHIVNQYANRLKYRGFKYEKELASEFQNKLYRTHLILHEDKLRLKDFNGDHEKLEEFKGNELKKFTKGFTFDDFIKLFTDIDKIVKLEIKFNGYHGTDRSLMKILENLYYEDRMLFLQVFEKIFQYQFSKKLHFGLLFFNAKLDSDTNMVIRNILKKDKVAFNSFPVFWNTLPAEEFCDDDLDLLYEYLNRESDFGFLDKFFIKNNSLKNKEFEIKKVINLILSKIGNLLGVIFLKDFFIYVYQNHKALFIELLAEIKSIYAIIDKMDTHFDYQLDLLIPILENDPTFIIQLLKFSHDENSYVSKRDLRDNDYSKLWELPNYKVVFSHIIEYLSKKDRFWIDTDSSMASLFKGSSPKELEFLKDKLENNSNEKELIAIFNVVLTKYPQERFLFLSILLSKNNDIDFFKKLDLYIHPTVTSGSRIPKYRNAITELESFQIFISSLPNSLTLLEHSQYLENRINSKKHSIELERKREFMDTYGT